MTAPVPQRPTASLETAALLHIGAYFTFATWAFGGNADRPLPSRKFRIRNLDKP